MSARTVLTAVVAASVVLGLAPGVAHGAPATTRVAGVVRYSTVDAKHPFARAIRVEIRDADGTANGALLGTVTTDDVGSFSFNAPTRRPNGQPRRLLARALTRSAGFTVHAVGTTAPYSLSSVPQTATGATQTVRIDVGNTGPGETAFAVTDALVTGVRYGTRVAGTMPTLSVNFPDAHGTNSTDTLMRVRLGDQFDWDVLLHEYGHAVAGRLGIDLSPGFPHTFGQNLAEPPHTKLQGLRDAWSEGFATYFALTAEDVLGAAALGIPKVGDAFYDDTDDNLFHVAIGTDEGTTSAGEDDELSVARTLWHFRVDAKTRIPDTTLVQRLRSAGATTLTAAVAALLPAASRPADRDPFDCVLTRQDVAPLVTAPGDGSTVSRTDPPTFTWVPHGAGSSHRLTKFVVTVFSPDWAQTRFTSKTVTGTSFTPTKAQWKGALKAGEAGLHVVVRGSSADAPTTGPYSSCSTEISDGGELTATPQASRFHPPAVTPACAGQTSPLESFFTLTGGHLTPSATYDIVLHAPNGAAPDVVLTPSTTDQHGAIAATSKILRPMPSGGSWVLVARPRHAGDITASVVRPIPGFACAKGDPDHAHTIVWDGVGALPGTTVTETSSGTVIGTATADSGATYRGSSPLSCTGQAHLQTSYTDIDGPRTITLLPFGCPT